MRTQLSLVPVLVLILSGCMDATAVTSVRARLASTTELLLEPPASSGMVTASHYTSTGWQGGSGAIAISEGALELDTDAAGDLEISSLAIDIQPIMLSSSVFGTTATLQDISLQLASPTLLPATWSSDDGATASAGLPMTLQWALDVDGVVFQLGSPQLPPLPTTLTVSGTGDVVNANISIAASGTLWSWADLLQLNALELTLSASSAF